MYYNKRLHPREAIGQYVEHKHGCVLHEFADQQEKQGRHSSMSSLDFPRRRLTSTGSTASGSTTNNYPRRDYYSRPSSMAESFSSNILHHNNSSIADSDDSSNTSYNTRSDYAQKISETSLKNVSFSQDCVDKSSYDSPERIIATLFPETMDHSYKQRSATWNCQSNRKGSVDSYLNKSACGTSTMVNRNRRSDGYTNNFRNSAGGTNRRKNIYRPDSLQTLDRDFQNLKLNPPTNDTTKLGSNQSKQNGISDSMKVPLRPDSIDSQQTNGKTISEDVNSQNDPNRPRFVAVTALEDVQAVRCAEFHPNGKVYSVGSNSKTFRICEYPSLSEIREEHTTYQPTVLFKRTKHHKGSIYCMAWSPQGDLVATGSNDKTVKLMRYNEIQQQLEGKEIELTMHDGTVRDLCFLEDSTNKTSLLISGGAGDCKVYVTDCATSTPFQALSGHGGHILSLYNWGGAMFVSGSQDKTVRFWDLRTRGCVNTVTPATVPGSRQGSPVAAVCVDPSGRLLVSGHEDSSCVLYDIRGNRPIQCFKPHATDIRSIRFSPSAYYLLTGGYDNKLVLTDLQGDLTMPLPSVVVAQHSDKVISGRWHPTDFSFLSTSADKTATLWALPPI